MNKKSLALQPRYTTAWAADIDWMSNRRVSDQRIVNRQEAIHHCVWAVLIPALVAFSVASCTSTSSRVALPELSVYAPAEVVEPHIPTGEPVDPTITSSLTLDQLLIYADSSSPAILTARARVGLADAEAVEADIAFPANPELSFGAGGRRRNGETGFEFEVAVEQQFEIAGERDLRVETARFHQQMAEAVVNEVRWSVHVETHRLFQVVLLLRERLAQAERFVAFAQSMRDIAAREVDSGDTAPLILLVADADLAQTRRAVIEARQMETALRTRLAAVVGWQETPLPNVEGQLPDVRQALDTEVLLGMMAEHHPSLRRRELAVEARRSQLWVEEREAWPEPTLGLSYGREAAMGPEAGADIWLVNLTLPIPLWRSNQGNRSRAEAEVVLADRIRSEGAVQLRSDLRQAAGAMSAAVDYVALYEQGVVPQLEQNLTQLQRAYELGEMDIHQVAQMRERLLNATADYIEARFDYFEATATLEGFVGTDLWPTSEENQ